MAVFTVLSALLTFRAEDLTTSELFNSESVIWMPKERILHLTVYCLLLLFITRYDTYYLITLCYMKNSINNNYNIANYL